MATPLPTAWATALTRATQLMTGRTHWGHHRAGVDTFWVRSATVPSVSHMVRVVQREGRTRAWCSCEAHRNRRPCWHKCAATIVLGYAPQEAA